MQLGKLLKRPFACTSVDRFAPKSGMQYRLYCGSLLEIVICELFENNSKRLRISRKREFTTEALKLLKRLLEALLNVVIRRLLEHSVGNLQRGQHSISVEETRHSYRFQTHTHVVVVGSLL